VLDIRRAACGCRQPQARSGTGPNSTLQCQRPSVPPSDPLADSQPQSGPAGGTSAGLIGAVKALEDVLQMLRRNALAGVADLHQGPIALGAEGQRQPPARRCVPNGIVQQVQEQLGQPGLVT
jgi:hypothetical protein